MSSFMFYSSPPPAPYQPHTAFFTPQANRSNLFATSYSQWSTFQPKSPSPLRSSPNTGNFMRRQGQHELNSKRASTGGRDENRQNENAETQDQYGPCVSNADMLYGSATKDTDFADTAPQFTFNAPAPTSTRNPFAFQQRARESAAATQVSSRISSNRDSRKAGFIDRLRRSRRDERDARGLDSFEKAEYWRERRERETRLRREAAGYDIDTEIDLLEPEFDDEEAQLSPIDDETEVAELVDAFYDNNQPSRFRVDDELMSDDFGMDEEEDYAEAFLEVLSQEDRGTDHPGRGNLPIQSTSGGGSGLFSRRNLDTYTVSDHVLEGDMDVS